MFYAELALVDTDTDSYHIPSMILQIGCALGAGVHLEALLGCELFHVMEQESRSPSRLVSRHVI